MNRVSILAVTLALVGTQALASGYTEPVVEMAPAPIAPRVVLQPADWTGAYVGLSYSAHGAGDVTFANPAAGPFSFTDGSGIGAVAGYTRQYGAWVLGGELAYYTNSQTVVGFPTAGLDSFIDVSGRVGHAWGAFQMYGLAGLSVGNYYQNSGADDFSLTGYHLGIGAEYLVNRNFSVGLQYVTRSFSGDNPNGLGQTVDINHDTVSLRGMFRF